MKQIPQVQYCDAIPLGVASWLAFLASLASVSLLTTHIVTHNIIDIRSEGRIDMTMTAIQIPQVQYCDAIPLGVASWLAFLASLASMSLLTMHSVTHNIIDIRSEGGIV